MSKMLLFLLMFSFLGQAQAFTEVCKRSGTVVRTLQEATKKGCQFITPADLSQVETFSFYYKGPRLVNTGDLEGLINLKSLDLDGLEFISGGALYGARAKHVGIYDSQLVELPVDLFSGHDEIETIEMGYNLSLWSLPVGIFNDLPSLKKLILYSNRLMNLDSQVFNNLKSLEELNLFQNKITEIPDGLFSGLSNLKRLSVDTNLITAILENDFKDLTALESLDLSHNPIKTIHINAFKGLKNLKTISLSAIYISEIDPRLFQDQIFSLKQLRLMGLRLSEDNKNQLRAHLPNTDIIFTN